MDLQLGICQARPYRFPATAFQRSAPLGFGPRLFVYVGSLHLRLSVLQRGYALGPLPPLLRQPRAAALPRQRWQQTPQVIQLLLSGAVRFGGVSYIIGDGLCQEQRALQKRYGMCLVSWGDKGSIDLLSSARLCQQCLPRHPSNLSRSKVRP